MIRNKENTRRRKYFGMTSGVENFKTSIVSTKHRAEFLLRPNRADDWTTEIPPLGFDSQKKFPADVSSKYLTS